MSDESIPQQSSHKYYTDSFHTSSQSRLMNIPTTPPPIGFIPSFPQPQPYQHKSNPTPTTAPYQQSTPTHTPPPPLPTPPDYTQSHADAASTIQNQFRVRKSSHDLDSLSAELDTLREGFHPPTTISFQKISSTSPANTASTINIPAIDINQLTFLPPDSDDDNVKIPKLAYNSTNTDINLFIDSLDKLLVKLDGVESWDNRDIRFRRRNIVKQIEMEQARVERLCKESWIMHIAAGMYQSR